MGKERLSGSFFATAVPSKGGKGRFDVDRCLEFIEDCGDKANSITLKSDQEPAMQYLVKEVALSRGSPDVIGTKTYEEKTYEEKSSEEKDFEEKSREEKTPEEIEVESAFKHTFIEEAPRRSSGSNGVVERAVQEIEGRLRAVLLGLEERLGVYLDSRERIIAFIPSYVAYLLNRLHEGTDGKTPYQRIRGKKSHVRVPEFGELVLYKNPPKIRLANI